MARHRAQGMAAAAPPDNQRTPSTPSRLLLVCRLLLVRAQVCDSSWQTGADQGHRHAWLRLHDSLAR
jgi:hypothetical protein